MFFFKFEPFHISGAVYFKFINVCVAVNIFDYLLHVFFFQLNSPLVFTFNSLLLRK